jgi:hypothetical protein
MIKAFVHILTFVITVVGYSQAAAIEPIEFESKKDYKLNEAGVLENARYVLAHPMYLSDANRVAAMQNVVKWMSGTPDYDFIIDESIGKLMKKNEDLLGLFMASMTKYVLENKNRHPGADDIKLNTFKIMLDYCQNEANGVKDTKELKKALDAHKKDRLKDYLRM